MDLKNHTFMSFDLYSFNQGDAWQLRSIVDPPRPHWRCIVVLISNLISNLYSPDTFWAPLFYCVMPWRTEEVYAKAFELINAASTFPWPADLDVMMDFEMYVVPFTP